MAMLHIPVSEESYKTLALARTKTVDAAVRSDVKTAHDFTSALLANTGKGLEKLTNVKALGAWVIQCIGK